MSPVTKPDVFPFVGGDRFKLVRRIASGGMGDVFEVEDHELGGRVALKTWETGDWDGFFRFKREFRAVAQLHHPNLLRVYDLFVREPHVFFTMELIDGETLDAYLADKTHDDSASSRLGATLPILAQILDALEHLHSHGIIHRDLKPANILVSATAQVKLVDFGILHHMGEPEDARRLGTPAYVSPEVAQGHGASPAADLYSLGVILRECLTGEPLFSGDTTEVVAAHRKTTPQPLRTLVDNLDTRVANTLDALLRKDPSQRPSIAVLRDSLGLESPDSWDTGIYVERSDLVGRDEEMTLCRGALRAAEDGELSAILLRGATGIGKSRLIKEITSVARHWGFTVLEGGCHEREVLAYRGFDPLVDQLCAELQSWPLSDLLPLSRSLADAARVFQVLRLPLGRLWQDAGKAPEARIAGGRSARGLALEAVGRLFAAAARRRPLLIAIDNWQWSGPEDAELIAELGRATRNRPVCICIGTRDLSPLDRFRATTRTVLDLRPLSTSAVEQLVGNQGVRAPAIRLAVARAAQGDLMLAAELARYVGSGVPVNDTNAVIAERLRGLTQEQRTILELLVCAQSALPVGTLRAASRLDQSAFFTAANALVDQQFIIIANQPSPDLSSDDHPALASITVEMAHERHRALVWATLSPAQVKARHRLMGLTMELHALNTPESTAPFHTLFHHWSEAEESARAWRYGAIAAEEAADRLAWEAAVSIYRRMLALRSDGGIDVAHAWRRVAELLGYAGAGNDAVLALRQALEALGEDGGLALPDGSDEATSLRFEVTVRLAGTLLRAGRLSEGEEVFKALLATLGLPLHRTPEDAMRTLTQLRVRVKAWSLVPDAGVLRHEATPSERARMLLFEHIFSDFALVRPLYMAEAQMRFQLLARRCTDPRARALDRTLEAAFVAISSGSHKRYIRVNALLDEAQAIVTESGDTSLEMRIAGIRGFVAWTSGNWRDARLKLEKVVRMARARGRYDEFDGFLARHWLILTCHYAGEHQRALELAGELVAAGPENVVRYSRGVQLHVFRCVEMGELELAQALMDLWAPLVSETPVTQTRFNFEAAQLALLLAKGELAAVVEHVEARTALMHAAGCQLSTWHRSMWNLPGFEASVRLWRAGGERTPATAVAMAQRLTEEAADYEACLAHAWLAMYADAAGDNADRDRHLSEALRRSAAAEAPYHRFRVLEVANVLAPSSSVTSELGALTGKHLYAAALGEEDA